VLPTSNHDTIFFFVSIQFSFYVLFLLFFLSFDSKKKHYQFFIVRISELIITINCLLNFCLILTRHNEIFSNLGAFSSYVFIFNVGVLDKKKIFRRKASG
jgi:hypothetical protein